QQIGAPDEVRDFADTEFGRPVAQILLDHPEDVDNALNGAFELTRFKRLQALECGFFPCTDMRRDADVTGAFVTLAADGTADGDHRHCAEADAIRAEAHHLDDIATGLHATVGPDLDLIPQAAFDQGTMRQPDTDFRRK